MRKASSGACFALRIGLLRRYLRPILRERLFQNVIFTKNEGFSGNFLVSWYGRAIHKKLPISLKKKG